MQPIIALSLRSLAAAALLAALSGPVPGSAAQERSHDTVLESALASGSTLEVRNISGPIVVTQASGGIVSIHAHAVSREQDPASVAIRMVRSGDRLVVCAVYPGGSCNALHEHHDGGNDDHDDVSVAFTIAIPHGVKLDANTVEGDIVARQLDADVSAHAVSGNLHILTSGAADAHTVSGSIDAAIARIPADADLAFETVSGSIRVTVPTSLNATITAKTLSGSVAGDHGLPFVVDAGSWVGASGSVKLGSGSAHISLRSVSGSIRVSAG